MKTKLLMALLLVAVAGQSHAKPYWAKFTVTEESEWWVDFASLKRVQPDSASIWIKLVPRSDVTAKNNDGEAMFRSMAQCDGSSVTVSSYVQYDRAGRVAYTNQSNNTMPMPPGSIYQTLFDILCANLKESGK
jgi:hypothetical protein